MSILSEQQKEYLTKQAHDFVVRCLEVMPYTVAYQQVEQDIRKLGDQDISVIQAQNNRFMAGILGQLYDRHQQHQDIFKRIQKIMDDTSSEYINRLTAAEQKLRWTTFIGQLTQSFEHLTRMYDQLLRENLQLKQEYTRLKQFLDQPLASLLYLLERLMIMMPATDSVVYFNMHELLEKKYKHFCVYSVSLTQQVEALTLKSASNQALIHQIDHLNSLQKFRAESQCIVEVLQVNTRYPIDHSIQQFYSCFHDMKAQLSKQQHILSIFKN